MVLATAAPLIPYNGINIKSKSKMEKKQEDERIRLYLNLPRDEKYVAKYITKAQQM